MNKKIRLICTAMVAVMILCCGCASKSSDYYEPAAPAEAPMMEEAAEMEMPYDAGYAAAYDSVAAGGAYENGTVTEGQNSASPNYGNQKIIATYNIDMKTDEFELHTSMLKNKALQLGGYIEYSDISGIKPETYNDPGRRASFTFRIPTQKAGEFLSFAEGTGVITSNNCETQNVTLNYFDMETRLEVLHTQLERLENILVETNNLADIIELEREIADVTLEIEQYTTQLRRYDDLIDYTTVNMQVRENRLATGPAARESFGERISNGLEEGLATAGAFLENALVGIISALPMLIIIAILIAIVVVIVRFIKKIFGKLSRRGAERREKKAQARKERMEKVMQSPNGSPNEEEKKE